MTAFKIFLTSLLLGPSVYAAVDMSTAGYVNLWTDYEFVNDGGYGLRVARIYKSRSTYPGIFGVGWCSPFETRLQVLPEGTLKISECGSGQGTVYALQKINAAATEKVIDEIIGKMKNDPRYKNQSAANLKKIRMNLFEDDEKRTALASEFNMTSAVQEKTPYLLNGSQVESVIWDKALKRYTRILPDGRSQRFDEKGRLTQNYDRHGNFLRIIYEKDRLVRVENSDHKFLRFSYSDAGFVAQIQAAETKISYRHSSEGDLLSAEIKSPKDQNTRVYLYEYDTVHNMTRAAWPDQTMTSLQYDRPTDRIKKIISRDGCSEEFTYRAGGTAEKPFHRSVSVRTCKGQPSVRETYEFWYGRAPAGGMVLARVRTDLDGKTEDILYDTATGSKTSVKNRDENLTYEYYESGQLRSRRSKRLHVFYTYVPGTQQVASCEQKTFDRTRKLLSTLKTSAKYNERAQLVEIENTEGQKLKISYDEKSRISRLITGEKKQFTVVYDDRHGKPSQITASDIGTVKISYKGSGDISSIDSADGLPMALRISSSYEKNLNILNPIQKVLYH